MVLTARLIGASLAASTLLALLIVGPAAAFSLNDECDLAIQSLGEDGEPLDSASPGAGGTQDDPFLIDWEGSVSYEGNTGNQVIMNHSWHIDVFLVPTPLRGGDPNEGGDQTAQGEVAVSANAPFKFSGLYFVSGEIRGEGGFCSGSGWFKLTEEPLQTIPFWIAVVLAVTGAFVIGWSLPTRSTVA
jgi:hypothetical protein